MKNDVIYDSKPRVSTGMRLEINMRESNLGHRQYGLEQWAVNGVACGVVNDVRDDGVPCSVVSSVFEFVYNNRIWVFSCSSLDGL